MVNNENRKFKDSIFRKLFGTKEELTLRTAKAVGFLLHGTLPVKHRSYAFSTSVDYSVPVCPTVHFDMCYADCICSPFCKMFILAL